MIGGTLTKGYAEEKIEKHNVSIFCKTFFFGGEKLFVLVPVFQLPY